MKLKKLKKNGEYVDWVSTKKDKKVKYMPECVTSNAVPDQRKLVVRKFKKLTKQEINMALQIPNNHPVWRVVNHVFQEELEDLQIMITDDKLAHVPNSLMRLAGGMAQVQSVYDRFIQLKSEASRFEKSEKE